MQGEDKDICRVCHQQWARYTCPRCNLRYCSLPCYKEHDQRCTEGFYRDNAVEQLQQTQADPAERHRMLQILKRIHDQELEERAQLTDADADSDDGSRVLTAQARSQAERLQSGAGEEEGEGEGAEEGEDLELSAALAEKLRLQLEAGGEDITIGEEDLTPGELQEFRRALAAGQLSGLVEPWQPWWLTDAAAQLQVGPGGTALVAETGSQPPDSTSTGAGGLPAPVAQPLPQLSALVRGTPSPLLRWQVLDPLYSYCLAMRLYNGDWSSQAQEIASTVLQLSAVLASTPTPSAAQQAQSSQAPGPLGTSAEVVVLHCLEAACHPAVLGQASRGTAVGVLQDVATMLALGRSILLLALTDLQRLLAAAYAASHTAAAPTGSLQAGRQPLRGLTQGVKALKAAERKAFFFAVWVHAQQDDDIQQLAGVVQELWQHHQSTCVTQAPAPRTPPTQAVKIEEV